MFHPQHWNDKITNNEITVFNHMSGSTLLGKNTALLPTGSEEKKVLGGGIIPVAILPSCKDIIKPLHYNAEKLI